MSIQIFSTWKVAFIYTENLSDPTVEWLDNNAYPLTDTDRDIIYDVRTCFDKINENDGELFELKNKCLMDRIGFIKAIDESNY